MAVQRNVYYWILSDPCPVRRLFVDPAAERSPRGNAFVCVLLPFPEPTAERSFALPLLECNCDRTDNISTEGIYFFYA
jgi:hypothetical protein